nr:MFS transporter [Luteimonas sp. BDR2-5]
MVYASNFADRIVVATVGQAMKVDLGLSDLQLGLLGGMSFALFYSLMGIPLARLSERYSRVRIIAACAAVWSAMTALCGVAQNYVQLLLLRIGVGIGEAGSTPASHSLIADYFAPGRRGAAFALFGLGIPLGAFVGAILGGWIVQHLGWRATFVCIGAPGLVLAALVLFTMREPRRGMSEAAAPVADGPVPSMGQVVRLLLRKPTFLHMTFGCALIGFANFGINMFMPIYFTRVFGMSYAQAGLAFGLITGCGAILGKIVGGYVSDWAGRRDRRWYLWVVALGVAVTAPFYMLAFLQQGWAASAAMLLVFGGLLYLWYGPTFAIAYSLVGPRMRASVSALVLLTISLIGHGLGPVFMGLASDWFAGRAYAGGDGFAQACGDASRIADGVAAACAQASAQGVRYAAIACACFFLWGAWHYFRAARTLERDTELPDTDQGANQ